LLSWPGGDLRGISGRFSPRLIEATRAGDGAGVVARTDTARVRRSLVDQIVSAYLKRLGRDRPVKTLERLAANIYGASIADAMIAQMMTEENLTKAGSNACAGQLRG
jgi:hypothetical protein